MVLFEFCFVCGALSLCSICIGLRKNNILKQFKLRDQSHNDEAKKKITRFRELLTAVNKALGNKGFVFLLTKMKKRNDEFREQKGECVHWDSISDLTPIFRDASQNSLCGANPGSERRKRRQRRKKVASVANRFVPYKIFSFYNQLSTFCRKLKALLLSPLAVTQALPNGCTCKRLIFRIELNGERERERALET